MNALSPEFVTFSDSVLAQKKKTGICCKKMRKTCTQTERSNLSSGRGKKNRVQRTNASRINLRLNGRRRIRKGNRAIDRADGRKKLVHKSCRGGGKNSPEDNRRHDEERTVLPHRLQREFHNSSTQGERPQWKRVQ